MMTRKTGRAAVLCIAVAVTIMLVATTWVVTSRHSKKASEPMAIVDQESEKTGIIAESKEPNDTKAKEDRITTEQEEQGDPYFKKLEQEFFANSYDEPEEGATKQDNTRTFMKPENTQKTQTVVKSGDLEAEIQNVRQEAGRIVERSGLFAEKDKEEDDMLVSVSDRDHGISSVKTSTEQTQHKDMKARERIILERQAYQEAKEKVDAMLRSLGYTDKI